MLSSLGLDRGPLGLFTDLYELRMATTCRRHGRTAPATFSLYIRPEVTRPWIVTGGTAAALDLLDNFGFTDEQLDYLASGAVGIDEDLVAWLADFSPTGELWAVPDGTVALGEEPLVEYTGPLPEAMLLETALLAVVGFPSLIATKAARCRLAAPGVRLADFGARRAHGLQAGLQAARAAYLGGVGATSNLEAGWRFGIPVVGTMAHSFVQAYQDERAAFADFAADHPGQAIMLVDTYDTLRGVEHTIEVGRGLRERGQDLDGVRLDSGDLAELARTARHRLDEAGFTDASIFASGGIDEHEIHRLIVEEQVPIDAFGIGTALTTSRDLPAFDIVYKLVAYDGSPRAKYSQGKVLLPAAKQVFRPAGPDTDVLARRDEELEGQRLLAPVWRDGRRLVDPGLEAARTRAQAQLEGLPAKWQRPSGLAEPPRPDLSDALAELARTLRSQEVDTLGGRSDPEASIRYGVPDDG